MTEKNISLEEKEKCRIEIEMKKQYYGSFVTNILNPKQIEKISTCKTK